MPLLSDTIRAQLQTAFRALVQPVRLAVFSQELECPFCRETRELATEIAGLSDKIATEVFNFVLDRSEVERYQIARIPAIAVVGEKDYGIRFYGIPAGYEFASLIEAIKLVSSGNSGLLPSTHERLQQLTQPIRIQVFVTLTCPYCAPQVHLAHRLAYASELITAEMIDSAEFPDLAHRFNVMAVPKTVINEQHQLEGAMTEEALVNVLLALQSPDKPKSAP